MRIHKIVVGVNETQAAVHALRQAAVIAGAAGAELIALTVVEDPWRRVTPAQVEGFRGFRGRTPADMAEQNARKALGQVVAEAIGAGSARLAVQFGLAGVELARWSELAGADLLVLGREPARGPAGRTTAGTLARSRVPCLLVPFGQRTWRHVMAAVGSGPGAPAVDEAATEFAALWDTVPLCVHAESSFVPSEPFAAPTRAQGGATTLTASRVVYGDTVSEVLKLARAEQTDVLVIGCHRGETAAEQGRVAPRLIERARCAVLTVPV